MVANGDDWIPKINLVIIINNDDYNQVFNQPIKMMYVVIQINNHETLTRLTFKRNA